MPPALVVATVSLVAGGVGLLSLLAFDGDPIAESSGVLLGADLLAVTVVAVAGLLLARSRWAWRLCAALVAGHLGFALAYPAAAAARVPLVVTAAVTVTALAAPAVRRWARLRPSPGDATPHAVVLLLALLAFPALVAALHPGGVPVIAAAGSLTLPVVAVLYSRGGVLGLWSLRVGAVVAVVVTAAASRLPGTALVTLAGGALVALSWHRGVIRAAVPLDPRPQPGYRIPPELTPPEVLEEAGLDERGRP